MSALVDNLLFQIRALNLPEPVQEHRFDAVRRWRFDLAWPQKLTAAEIDGGVFSGGRHVRGVGFEKDAEKLNAATAQGWRVYRFTGGMVHDGSAVKTLEKALRVTP